MSLLSTCTSQVTNPSSYGSPSSNTSAESPVTKGSPTHKNPVLPSDTPAVVDGSARYHDGNLVSPADASQTTSSRNTASWHGYCRATLILRSRMHPDFGARVTSLTAEMRCMAQDLFDRYGRLRPEFVHHPVMRGSGLWGMELSFGDILMIDQVLTDVSVYYRGKGRAVFNRVLESVKDSDLFIVLTRIKSKKPETLEDGAREDRLAEARIAFVRSLGFRRVGNTSWFAFSLDPDHRSRQSLPHEDYDPPLLEYPVTPLFEFAFHIIPWHDESLAIGFFINALRSLHTHQIYWPSMNDCGRTVMHEAALRIMPTLLNWLMDHAPQLTVHRDSTGATPFEALRGKLDRRRTFHPDPDQPGASPDEFLGFTDPEVACLSILDTSIRTDSQLRFGCTCGRCIGGYLSPRLARRLRLHSWDYYDRLIFEADGHSDPYCALPDSCFHPSNLYMKGVLHSHTRVMFLESLSLRLGFANMFAYLSQCLEYGQLPTDGNMMAYLSTSGHHGDQAREFLEHGGSFQIIRSIVFDDAAAHSEWAGSGSDRGRSNGDGGGLPECRNDLEFILAERMCNIDSGIFLGQVSAASQESPGS
ncbi:hypothetical protein NLU13_0200 [Sarocladium strictum]|uniref:Uncharacterized protein n=1 Tax=Sarocladium strictum TaxID=5046 RepID=A0AA39GNM7_SARSR|nr:hypothetical protein NLU13_0200 [Sarocladium strictum]